MEIATKINGGPIGKGYNAQGLPSKTVFQEVENSLQKLNTSYIDLLYIHR